jgi:hypothetical protein
MLDRVRDCAADFDVLYFHIDQFHFPLFRRISAPVRRKKSSSPVARQYRTASETARMTWSTKSSKKKGSSLTRAESNSFISSVQQQLRVAV